MSIYIDTPTVIGFIVAYAGIFAGLGWLMWIEQP